VSAYPAEAEDAKLVDRALQAMANHDLPTAEGILRDVVSRTPAGYVHQFEEGGQLHIRFWSTDEFVRYVTLPRAAPLKQGVLHIANAYPRAYYHLGFLFVQKGDLAAALQWLDAGLRLESHPMLRFEKGNVLLRLHRFDEAFRLFDSVVAQGDEIAPATRAMGMRGKGFVLIERGSLDEAEAVFRASLELDPDSGVARNELRYIQNLRGGGRRTAMQSVQADLSSAPPQCFRCGTTEINGGKVVNVKGQTIYACKACLGKLTKKWWEFWK